MANLVLRGWRETHGMTRTQMADALSEAAFTRRDVLICRSSLIARWETGRIRWPSPKYQRALHALTGRSAAALGFTPRTPHAPVPGGRASSPEEIRQAVTTALADTGLRIDQAEDELIITNPARPDRGQVHVSLDDGGYVSWLRETDEVYGDQVDYFGRLEGITSDHDDDHTPEGARPVPALMILHLLTASTDPRPPNPPAP